MTTVFLKDLDIEGLSITTYLLNAFMTGYDRGM